MLAEQARACDRAHVGVERERGILERPAARQELRRASRPRLFDRHRGGDLRRWRRDIALTLAAAAPACGRKREAELSAPSPAPSAPSPDRLAKGEIPEGSARAFTLPLPLRSTVTARFTTTVLVASPHTPEELTSFVRARVTGGEVSTSPTETRFERVVVTKHPSRSLTVRVSPGRYLGDARGQLEITDVTPPREAEAISEEERWRRAGLSPDGKLLDRDRLQ